MVVGGGIGGIILLIIALIFGINPGSLARRHGHLPPVAGLDPGPGPAGRVQTSGDFSQCKTGADANKNDVCRIIAHGEHGPGLLEPASCRTYKHAVHPRQDGHLQRLDPVGVRHGLQPGRPVLLPARQEGLHRRELLRGSCQSSSASSGGPLAQEYVVAHEYGHHVQDLLGCSTAPSRTRRARRAGSVRIELMADCLAGVWAKHATETEDAEGTTLLKPLTEQDIQDALSAASSVGDDRIQQKTQGQVSPETWTHGSSAARQTLVHARATRPATSTSATPSASTTSS